MIPSYHDLFITTPTIERTSIFDLPYNVQVTCQRTSGWKVWSEGDVLIGGEYSKDSPLRLDVAGYVICDYPLADGQQKSRYIAVAHHWFIDSSGFTVQEINADSLDDAEEKGNAMQRRLNSTFHKTAVQIINVGDATLLYPRKLTLWERLTGQLSAPEGSADE